MLFCKVPTIEEPLPELAKPVTFTMLLRVQLKVVPTKLFGFVIKMDENGELPQMVCVEGDALIVGFGLTVIVIELIVVPHPFASDVMVNVVV